MTTIESETKKWGNSIGIIIPREIIAKENIKENQKITVIIIKDSSKILRESFGMLKGKLKESGQEIKDRSRRELY